MTGSSTLSPSLVRAVAFGLGGGFASAALLYSAVRGSVGLSTLLLILTPLPSLIVALGWGLPAALAAAGVGAVVMAVAVAPVFAAGYLLALGVPVAGVAHFAFLARYDANGVLQDWYPVGRVLAALALYGAALPVLVVALGSGTFTSLEAEFTQFFKALSERAPIGSGWRRMDEARLQFLVSTAIEVLPAAIASYWTLFMAINLYLAARVTRLSGRLLRPWPDLHWMSLPRMQALVFGAALAGIWIGGAWRVLGAGAFGACMTVYVLQGLSVVHAIGRARAPWLLYATYATLAVAGAIAIPLTALAGLIENLVRLRARVVSMPAALPPGSV